MLNAGNHEYTYKRKGGDQRPDPSGSRGYSPDWGNFGNGAPLHRVQCPSLVVTSHPVLQPCQLSVCCRPDPQLALAPVLYAALRVGRALWLSAAN